ncbi:BRO1-like domain-containing protein [Melampsora americana]|nr:BRO1-like domain-containing protein [Melampsora americana]
MSTTQAPLLWVPSKSTSDVSYGQSIRQTITQTYQESPDTYKEEILALDRCRQDALRGSAGSDVTGRDLLYKYFGQLELLELRFPEVRVPFPWKDAFTGKEISQLSLAYEKASVIFNIAATLSSLAAQQNRTSTEGIRRAFHNFRCAAGMFTYINDNFLHAPSTDLSREVVKVLVQLMIAQATEVFVERMTEEKEKKPFGLRARVSTQAAFLYGSILEDVKDLVTKGIFERSWTWLVQASHIHIYFTIYSNAPNTIFLLNYQRSLADAAASKHGEALTRLQIAETAAKEAHRFANSFSAAFTNSGSVTLPSDAAVSLSELTKTHLTLCTEARTSEQRDNDLIYHEAQPSEAALTPIEKSSVGEPIPIQEVYGAAEVQKVVGQDIFIRLVPLSVHQSSSLYSEEKAKLVRTDGEKCDLADTELATTLEFLGLPASLDKFNDLIQNNGDSTRLNELSEPPAQVLEWADSIQQANSGKTIDQMCRDMIALRNKTNRDLEDIERALDTEARDCEQMRVRYDHLWEQAPALNFTKSWRQDIKSHRQTLEMAKQSDSQVESLWAMSKADIQILADRSGESIRTLFSSAQHDSTNAPSLLDMVDTPDDEAELIQVKNLVTSIQENLNRLQAIKKERQGVLKDLKERIQADDISQLLILNRKVQNVEPALFSAELEKFRAHSGRISATLHIQTSTIQELVAQYKALVEGKRGKAIQDGWNHASKHRTQVLARLQRAYENHEEIRSGLSKGSQFYRDISDAVSDMQRQVSTYTNNRNAERVQMAAKAEAAKERYTKPSTPNNSTDLHGLEQRVSGMHLNHSKAYPPPLPPPPPGWQSSSNTGPVPSAYPQQSRQASTPLPVSQHPPPPPSDPYAGLGSLGQAHSTPSSEPQYPYNNTTSYRQPMSNYPAPSAPNQALPPPPPPISYQSTGNLSGAYPPPLPPSHRHNDPTQYYPSPPPPQAYQPPPPQHSQSHPWPPNQSSIHPQQTSQRPSPAPPSFEHPTYPSSHYPPPHGTPYAPQAGWQGHGQGPPPPPPPPQGSRPPEQYPTHQASYPNPPPTQQAFYPNPPPTQQTPYPSQPPRNPY